MCCGAIFWGGVRKVVYGLPESGLYEITGGIDPDSPMLRLPAERVFACGTPKVEVVGPVCQEQAVAVHAGFWETLCGKPHAK